MPGKSERTEWVVRLAIVTGRNMLLATANPEWWHKRLKQLFPGAKMKRTEHGVVINPKSK